MEEGQSDPARDTYWGYHIGVAAGLQLRPWERFGFYGRMSLVYAPVIDNLIGDTHDSGGLFGTAGVVFGL
jgi:hypothetical protein